MTEPTPTVADFPTRVLGRRLLHFAEIDSTSDEARRRASDPDSHGLAILADHQTAGRGQHGRVWQSPSSLGMLMSLLVRPPDALRQPAKITALAAVAVRQTVFDLTGLLATIKWPNDILIGGLKVCGILCESAGPAIVVGIGLNVLHSQADFDRRGLPLATSLAMHTLRPPSIPEVCDRLLTRLDEDYAGLERGEVAPLENRWRAGLDLDGVRIEAESHAGETVAGRLVHLGFDALAIETPDGRTLRWVPERVRRLGRDPGGRAHDDLRPSGG